MGHQPILGETIALLLGLQKLECAVKKGAVWWLRYKLKENIPQVTLLTVQSPELL
jgi:phosphohistidine phosphatase